jgi:K+-sensing histidine kinase KdpD
MVKFFMGAALGVGLTYAFLIYPQQSRKVVQTGIDTASSAIAQGTQAAEKAADKQLK